MLLVFNFQFSNCRILARRFKSPLSKIKIIGRRGQMLIFAGV